MSTLYNSKLSSSRNPNSNASGVLPLRSRRNLREMQVTTTPALAKKGNLSHIAKASDGTTYLAQHRKTVPMMFPGMNPMDTPINCPRFTWRRIYGAEDGRALILPRVRVKKKHYVRARRAARLARGGDSFPNTRA